MSYPRFYHWWIYNTFMWLWRPVFKRKPYLAVLIGETLALAGHFLQAELDNNDKESDKDGSAPTSQPEM